MPRKRWLDFLKLIGQIGIISIHTSQSYSNIKFKENENTFSGMIALSMFGGPFISVYMILSGFFILNEIPDIKQTIKRIKKLVLLFIKI